ncbi:MAG: GGDEF domain-containing protein [Archangium sp.]|nr:GGDEF domain-containing protein [Archangium sp.]
MPRKHTTAITVISKISERAVSRAAALVVIHGEDLGRKFDLTTEETLIGRTSKADIQVDQDSVSRHHAKIRVDGTRITVEDMGSTNGTIVNDEHIEETLRLRNGDLVKIGRTIFKFIASNNIEAAYHDEIYRMTTVDGLTQVFNRRYFEDAIERELSRSRRYTRPLSLVLLDIDHFKKINDTYGHLAGDAVLKEMALTVRARTRREDVFARFGGEEFALLLPEVDQKGAAHLAEKARKLVEKHTFIFDGEDIAVTMSAGVATVQKKNESHTELIRRADEKLYEAKSAGRNRVAM